MKPLDYPIPVWQRVDALVVGSDTSAVVAALRMRELGLSVAILADEIAFGADLAHTFHLWTAAPVTAPPFLARLFAIRPMNRLRPLELKCALEQELLRANIPFLFNVRPVSLLHDSRGRAAGVVAAARTSLFAVCAGTVLDASARGLLVRLSGAPLARRSHNRLLRWRVFKPAATPLEWPGEVRELEPCEQRIDGEWKKFPLCELTIPRFSFGPDEKNLLHEMRSTLVHQGISLSASRVLDVGDAFLPYIAPAEEPESLSIESLRLENGLWVANPLLPVRNLESPLEPSHMIRLGLLAAEAAAESHQCGPSEFEAKGGPGWQSAEVFLRRPMGWLEVPEITAPDWGEVAVLVVGGGTGGAPAAIAAARGGACTLCVENGAALGGVGTLGMISSYWFGNLTGFTEEVNEAVCFHDERARSKRGRAWNPEVKSSVLHRMLAEAGGSAWLGSFVVGVRDAAGGGREVLITTPCGTGRLRAGFCVDATGNADLAVACGASFRVIGSEHVAVQGTGLSPRLHPEVPAKNSDHTFVDDNDPEGITAAFVQARAKYPDSFDTALFLNTRERRQILGELELSPLDILAGRTFPDTIVCAASNFDTHGFTVHPVFMVAPADKTLLKANVPLRAMIPRGVEHVLVTGLAVCAHRDALPVIRMQADVQNQGYAAGLLAAELMRTGASLKTFPIKEFQKKLVQERILAPEVVSQDDSFPLPEEMIRRAALGPLDNPRDVAIVFAHAAESRQILLARLDDSREIRLQVAVILGLMGDAAGADILIEELRDAQWDEGWNFRGMHQFGASMSRRDAMIIALSETGHPSAASVVARLAGMLGEDASFSHCRAVAHAAARLRDSKIAAELERVLSLPGVAGHHHCTVNDLLADADSDSETNRSRNLSLREIALARGLFESGDPHGTGRRILEAYAGDLRGHFARHARALLESKPARDSHRVGCGMRA